MKNLVTQAVEILRAGGLVAFPTETVYGLGGDATNENAVRKIFTVKGRPATNPLIAHVADVAVARRYARRWSDSAEKLARAFWPGPLTLVLPKEPSIVDAATAGRDTVALRVPNHPLTLELLRGFDGPLAGPSANRSTRFSPTTAEHVRQELGDKVDLILDGGACEVGIESTVVDLSADQPVILRPGGISRDRIEALIGPVDLAGQTIAPNLSAPSPGMHEIHYSPRTPAWWFNRADAEKNLPISLQKFDPSRVILVSISRDVAPAEVRRIPMPADATLYARRLYAALREADHAGGEAILIEMPPDQPDWTAVRDRLRRASRALAQKF